MVNILNCDKRTIACEFHRHWYVPTGECLHTMTGHTASVNAVLISSNGSKIVSASSDAMVKVWNSDPPSR